MTVALLSTLALGALLGMRHATDADHVVAVTTIVTRQSRLGGAFRIGALWGLGHTVTIAVVGGAIILLHVAIPPRLGLAMEFTVALMLIGLGVWNLVGERAPAPGALASARPVLVGVVHGLAGSAAVALLVLATLPEPGWAMGYLLLFGAGTVAGMIGVTLCLAAPMLWSVSRFARWRRSLQFASGGLSAGVGLFLAVRITLVDGLFFAHPPWVPW